MQKVQYHVEEVLKDIITLLNDAHLWRVLFFAGIELNVPASQLQPSTSGASSNVKVPEIDIDALGQFVFVEILLFYLDSFFILHNHHIRLSKLMQILSSLKSIPCSIRL